ncbi:transcription elongation factor GreA [Leekyejoonella antrihumi]|uniref:Transcription elongation factor GreA n=1 Tax=Leekyejoonella antrihumi TaxID=1660198 RepID=A0A563E0Y7_9MICO|nr:transcription elongation factor GreA [Leekyejoonella antrihumi]TWP36200.1 transcription elongation factor GreA [Leekyejoonella antrihumi]
MTSTADSSASFLTPEAYDRLKAELANLQGAGRSEISQRIEDAREEGDLKENGGYHAAKEEQGKMEARIRQLDELLRTAVVGNASGAAAAAGTVSSGMVVTVEMFGDKEKFLLGNREIAEDSEIDVYSERSPLGQAILGKKIGDTTSYNAPNGNTVEVKVLEATPYA